MKVAELIENIPKNKRDIKQIKRKLLSWDLYRDNLYSDNFKATQILVSLKDGLTTDKKEKIYLNIKKVLQNHQKHNIRAYIAGTTAINVQLGDKMLEDIKHLIPFIVIVIILALYLFFRKTSAVLMTILTVIISTIWAVGLMAWFDINMTLVSTVIPVLLIAVGSAYGIHILSHYYDELRKHDGKITREKNRKLVLKTVSKIGKPIFLAGLTTVVGFGSLSTSQIVPIKTFGIFTAIGIVAAFLVAIFMIPALLIIKFDSQKINGNQKNDRMKNIIEFLHDFYAKKKLSIMVIVLIVIIFSLTGMSRIIIDSPLIEMFKKDTDIRIADNFINNHFSGTSMLNVMVNGKKKGSLTNPEVLKSMEKMQNYLKENFSEVGRVTSFTDFLKRMNQVMNYPEENTNKTSGKTIDKKEKTTTNFGSESTSNFSNESTSNFSQENTSTFDEKVEEGETTTNFGKENTSEFETETTSSSKEKSKNEQSKSQPKSNNYGTYQKITGPATDKISEKDFAVVLNNALIRASKMNLSGEELVNLVNRELNYKGAAYYEIPYNPDKYPVNNKQELKNLISQYLLLYSGNLDDLINDQLEPSKARMLVQMNDPSNLVTARIKQEILNYTDSNFPENYHVTVSGHANMALAANNLIISSQIMSIFLSFVIVFLIVAFSYKSIIAGIYGIIPLAFSLLINFGFMGYSGIKLDIGTSMVASIAIGIGVDYTIHFLSTYHYERKKTDDLNLVTRRTLTSSGKAIIFNAISVAAGFLVLIFSNFYPLVYLGLLIAITMFTSSIASLTILPILLNVFKPKFISQ